MSQLQTVPNTGSPNYRLSQIQAVPTIGCPKYRLSQLQTVPNTGCPKYKLPQLQTVPTTDCPKYRLPQLQTPNYRLPPNTDCPKYRLSQLQGVPFCIPEHGSCHGMSRQLQALNAIKTDVFINTTKGRPVTEISFLLLFVWFWKLFFRIKSDQVQSKLWVSTNRPVRLGVKPRWYTRKVLKIIAAMS
jgi:hypothetical protein